MLPDVTRRPGTEADRAFLVELHRRALGPHVEATYGGWDAEQQRGSVFRTSTPADHEILELQGEPIGCLLLAERPEHVALQRIFLLPEHQNRGIGAGVVRQVLAGAARRGKPVRLRVFRVSPAVRFYERLGFRRVGQTETHVLMEHGAGSRA